MLKPTELTLEEMGDLAAIIPAADPEVKVRYRPIPDFDQRTNQSTRRSLIPVCEPTLTGNEMKYVQQAVETNWISSAGSFIRDFEAQFAEACGVKYGIACANGTLDVRPTGVVLLADWAALGGSEDDARVKLASRPEREK